MKEYLENALYEWVIKMNQNNIYNENELKWMNYYALFSLS
jgi:hypothetical protein